MTALTQAVAYCGEPPSPANLWLHWRLDPIVLSVLLGLWLLYGIGSRRLMHLAPGHAATRVQRVSFHVGWLIATLALVSPLCPLSVSLFSARVSQHMVLTMLAAPLVAAGWPIRTIASALRLNPPYALSRRAGGPVAAALAFAVLIWLWHAPAVYEATFRSVIAYWLMHLTLFASALWLWTALQASDTHVAFLSGLFASVLSSVQMGLLGALITLAPQAFYPAHFLTAATWGLTPLEDQQLGGIVMWVPGCGVFLVGAMLTSARCLFAGRRALRTSGELAR